jgi:hypothetical protein
VPQLLRFRIGLAALLAVFLIPIALSSLRGLDHVLTCSDLVESPFEVILFEDADPVVIGSTALSADETVVLCGGLVVSIVVARSETADVDLTVVVENQSQDDWFGTLRLDVAGIDLPVDLGRVDAGSASSRQLDLDLPDGTSSFGGALLIGP